jgi:Zn-finger protein
MSSINGIYILKFLDQSRVIQAQGFENTYWSYRQKQKYNYIPINILKYFKNSKAMTHDEADKYASELAKECSLLEYGIKTIIVNKTWDEVVKQTDGDEIHTCVDCHYDFVLKKSEIEFYILRNLQLPKRCEGCREDRKNPEKALENYKRMKRKFERYWD